MCLRSITMAAALAALSSSASSQKITVDPNSGPASSVTEVAPDARLDQPVSCDAGYVRLHELIADISARTGVKLSCGKGSSDWQTRDLPMIVHTRELPLRVLLTDLADAAHLTFAKDKPEKPTDAPSYRLHLDSSRRGELRSFLDAAPAERQAVNRWAWDSLVKLADLPESAFTGRTDANDPNALRWLMLRSLSQALRGVDRRKMEETPAGRGDVTLYVRGGGEEFSQLAMNAVSSGIALCAVNPPTESRICDGVLLDSPLTAKGLGDPGWERTARIRLRVGPLGNGDVRVELHTTGNHYELSLTDQMTALVAGLKSGSLPPVPDTRASTRPIGRCADADLRVLATEADWRSPLLETKINIRKPAGEPTWDDAVKQLAESANVSIICEDFESHRSDRRLNLPWGTDTTLAQILKAQSDRYTWLINENRRVLVGWSRQWPERHNNLIPRNLLDDLARKLDSTGVQLDDVTPLAAFSEDAFVEWIARSRDLAILSACFLVDRRGPWSFYDSLTPAQKLLAKSDAGLPLGTLDPVRVAAVFGQDGPGLTLRVKTGTACVISGMLVVATPEFSSGTRAYPHRIPEALGTQTYYHLSLSHGYPADKPREGMPRAIDGPCQAFPLYSLQREQELLRQASAR